MVEVSLTVGKLDASLALLLTNDHHLIEFPTILLPDGVQAGSIVKIKCERDIGLEEKELLVFDNVQEEILHDFGQLEPEPPVLKVKNITQTLCVLEWEPLSLSTANIKLLTLYKNRQRLGQIPNPLINTTTKLSGLSIDTDFKFLLRLDTTAGVYNSQEIEVRTHKMTDLSGITVCLGEINWEEEGFKKEDLEQLLVNIGAKPIQESVKVDTTHFVCTLAKGSQWKKANDSNIPVVRPEWLKACEAEKRIVGVRMFYLDANSEIIKQHSIVGGTQKPEVGKRQVKEEKKSEVASSFDDVPLTEDAAAKEDNNVDENSNKPDQTLPQQEVKSKKEGESEAKSKTEVVDEVPEIKITEEVEKAEGTSEKTTSGKVEETAEVPSEESKPEPKTPVKLKELKDFQIEPEKPKETKKELNGEAKELVKEEDLAEEEPKVDSIVEAEKEPVSVKGQKSAEEPQLGKESELTGKKEPVSEDAGKQLDKEDKVEEPEQKPQEKSEKPDEKSEEKAEVKSDEKSDKKPELKSEKEVEAVKPVAEAEKPAEVLDIETKDEA